MSAGSEVAGRLRAQRAVVRRVHGVAGGVALLLIATFLVATVVVELSGDPARIAAVKRAIAWALLVLVPALAVAGGSGFSLAGGSRAPAVERKRRRMRWIGANGLLVLVPCALALNVLAGAGAFGSAFVVIQGVELVAGPVNLLLLGLQARDGLRMTGRISGGGGSGGA